MSGEIQGHLVHKKVFRDSVREKVTRIRECIRAFPVRKKGGYSIFSDGMSPAFASRYSLEIQTDSPDIHQIIDAIHERHDTGVDKQSDQYRQGENLDYRERQKDKDCS